MCISIVRVKNIKMYIRHEFVGKSLESRYGSRKEKILVPSILTLIAVAVALAGRQRR